MIQPFVILFAHTVEYLFPKGFDISFSDIHLSRHNKHFVKRQCACLWMCNFFLNYIVLFEYSFKIRSRYGVFFLFIVQRLLKFTCTSNKLLLGSLYGSFLFIFQDFFLYQWPTKVTVRKSQRDDRYFQNEEVILTNALFTNVYFIRFFIGSQACKFCEHMSLDIM